MPLLDLLCVVSGPELITSELPDGLEHPEPRLTEHDRLRNQAVVHQLRDSVQNIEPAVVIVANGFELGEPPATREHRETPEQTL